MSKKAFQTIKIYFSPRVFSMAILGIPYGMMYFLAVPMLQTWLKDKGIANPLVGFFSIISTVYVVKFLWAPLVNYLRIPWLYKLLGHRRSWLVFSHIGLIIVLLLIASINPEQHLAKAAFLGMVLAFFAGIQDIVVDTYRIEILTDKQIGPGIGMLVTGYRIGSMLAQAGVLYLADILSWNKAYAIMTCFVSLGIVAALTNPEPKETLHKKEFFKEYVVHPLQEFFQRAGWGYVVCFIVLFRFGDALINNMVHVFYLEIGFSKTQIAHVTKVFGMGPTILGGLIGSALMVKHNIYKLLLFGGITHCLAHVLFIFQSTLGACVDLLYAVIICENLTGGLSTAVFLGYLSKITNRHYASVQFSFLTSLWSCASVLASFGGWLTHFLDHNWKVFFEISLFASMPSLFLIPRLRNKIKP